MPLEMLKRRHIRPLVQSAYAECGLVCIAMILEYYGIPISLGEIRGRWQCSPRALRLTALIDILDACGVASRPLKAEMSQLAQVKCPSIIHWDFNHYVVLERVSARHALIVDPAIGRRKIDLGEVSRHFTGVVLEVGGAEIKPRQKTGEKPLGLSDLIVRWPSLLRLATPVMALTFILNCTMLLIPLLIRFSYEKIIPGNLTNTFDRAALVFLLIPIIYFFLQVLRSEYLSLLREQLTESICEYLFRNLIFAKSIYFEARSPGRVINQYNSAQAITSTLSEQITSSSVDAVFVIGGIVLLCFASWAVALIVAVSAAAVFLIQRFSMNEISSRLTGLIQCELNEHGFLTETVESMTAIRVYAGEMARFAIWRNIHKEVRGAQNAYWKRRLLVGAVQDLVVNISWLFSIYMSVRLCLAGNISLGMVAAAVSWANVVLARSKDVTQGILAAYLLKAHLARVEDLIRSPKITTAQLARRAEAQSPVPQLEIGMRDVWYRYDEFSPWVLKSCSFRVPEGSFTGISGISGIGKTTLMKILMGVLEPVRGEVTVNADKTGEAATEVICANAGIVMQGDTLLQGSVVENISFFDIEPDLQLIEECARIACISDFIEANPSRYDTILGPKGQGLSAGQIQRILLARALYRQPKILLLDEFSSNIDEETERMIISSIKKIGITILSIAHRKQVLLACDHIYSIDGGQAAIQTFQDKLESA